MRTTRAAIRAFALVSALGATVALTNCSSPSSEEGANVGTVQQASLISPDLVISQVYGGGGNSNAPYKNDFVEIFNRGSSTVQLQGYSIQYASAAGGFGNNNYDLPMFSLQSGQYFLIQLASGGNVGNALPSPDANGGNINMSASAGKVALVLTNAKLTCGDPNDGGLCNSSNWVDFIGYGSTASQYEGSQYAPAGSNTTAMTRAAGGCSDTGENKNDFTVPAPNPRNSMTSLNLCDGDGGQLDSGSDTGSDAASDSASDAASDSASDSGSDADPDAAQDSGSDADPDAAQDGGSSDSGSDAGPQDSGPDAAPDSGIMVTLGKLAISQVYGGGGNSMATYTNDYVEIINRDTKPIDTIGYAIQYASPTGTFSSASNAMNLPSLTLQPGQYFLVQLASGGATGMALPTADAVGNINLGATNGKVALVLGSKLLNGCGNMASPCMPSDWIDLVGFGSADEYEGSAAAPAGANTKSLFRAQDGCVDTDDNKADFTSNAPTPRNSSQKAMCASSTDGGTNTDGGSTMDSGTTMDGSTGTDGSTSGDATVDGSGKDGATGPIEADGGCSCNESSSNNGSGNGWSALAGLALVVTLRGRRRRLSSAGR